MTCDRRAGAGSEHAPKQQADTALQNGHAHMNGDAPSSSGQSQAVYLQSGCCVGVLVENQVACDSRNLVHFQFPQTPVRSHQHPCNVAGFTHINEQVMKVTEQIKNCDKNLRSPAHGV